MDSITNLKSNIRSAAMELRLSVELLLIRVFKNKVSSQNIHKKIEFLSELNLTYWIKRNQWIMYIL